MKPLEVGCTVEVLPPGPGFLNREEAALRDSWTGRILTVVRFGTGYHPLHGTNTPCVYCVPHYQNRPWLRESLRRIDPPDWEAPRVTEDAHTA